MKDENYSPELHAASVARLLAAEANRRGPKSLAEHKAAEQEFRVAWDAHDERFGQPFKRDGVWH